jgi:hypothetical protein
VKAREREARMEFCNLQFHSDRTTIVDLSDRNEIFISRASDHNGLARRMERESEAKWPTEKSVGAEIIR